MAADRAGRPRDGVLRPFVAESWRRSEALGIDPDALDPDVLPDADLADQRARHPLAGTMPIVRDLLVDAVAPDGLVVALSDDAGRLLWVEGDRGVRRAVGRIGFVEGALWREDVVGTNAPGTALATDRPVQVLGAEHFTRPVQRYNCAAAPIHDLASGRLLGVLDVTGGSPAASGMMLSLVRASAAAVERDLAARGMLRVAALAALGSPPGAPQPPVLAVLGHRAALRVPDAAASTAPDLAGAPPGAVHRPSLRHAEILLLLAEHPHGLTADELAVLLSEGELSDVTVRAELSRLRRVVGPLLGEGRPYRLAGPLVTDVATVRAHLAAGDVAAALAAYPGPVLPRSVAPGVERVRAELAAEVRSAVLLSDDAAAVERFAAGPEGAEDHGAWTRLAALSAPGSPRWTRARGRLALLRRTLR